MKLAVTVLTVFCLVDADSVKTKFIKQKVNNNDDNDKTTWDMWYMVNEKYFKDGGPMFILVGGEIPINEQNIEWGLFVEMAEEHQGILFRPEHRFYGKSKVGKSLSMENLQFLNAHQALADLANFIRTQRANDLRLTNSKVIIAGCSYAGSLAVWFSRLYPDLVDGTWAVSAPILAKAEFPEYFEITGKAIRELGSPQCYDRIQRGMGQLQAMFSDGREKEAAKMLKMCNDSDYSVAENKYTLFQTIAKQFAKIVVAQRLEKEDIPRACDFLMKRPDDISAIADYYYFLNSEYIDKSKNCSIINFLGTVFHYKNTSYDNAARPWIYQVCNEFGWFQVLTSKQQPFGTLCPVEMDMKACYDIFGSDFTEDRIRQKIAATNKAFGGLKPNVKNLFMTYGSLDPWTALGPGESDISTVVPQYAHCHHLDSRAYISQTSEMKASKDRILAKVREWLA